MGHEWGEVVKISKFLLAAVAPQVGYAVRRLMKLCRTMEGHSSNVHGTHWHGRDSEGH